MRCGTCGESAPEGSRYCPHCATPLSKTPADAGNGPLEERERVRSAEIVAHLARTSGRPTGEAAAVVDGFWGYVADPKHHLHGSRDRLVVPHFGVFRQTRGRLAFASSLRNRLAPVAGKASSGWIDRLESSPEKLSVRRRITVAVARSKGLDLRNTHALMSELFSLLTRIFVRGRAKVVWTRRGVMAPDGSRYRFRPYPSFGKRLPWEV